MTDEQLFQKILRSLKENSAAFLYENAKLHGLKVKILLALEGYLSKFFPNLYSHR